jgi:hypothetical protein
MSKQPASEAPGKTTPQAAGGADRKLRSPGLPPVYTGPFGEGPGEPCGIVRGGSPACARPLYDDAGTPRCPVHCREETRNADALSLLCPAFRSRGRTKCKHHGGRTRAGAAHPGHRTGEHSRWSRHVSPARRALARQLASGDPLDILDDLHLLRTRVAELVEAADAHGVPDYDAALPLAARAIAAVSRSDDAAALSALRELEGVLSQSRSVDAAWDRVDRFMKSTTKMIESQRKKAIEGGKFVTAEDVMEMFNQLGKSLKKRAEELLPKELGDRLLTQVGADWAAAQGVDTAPLADDAPPM